MFNKHISNNILMFSYVFCIYTDIIKYKYIKFCIFVRIIVVKKTEKL